MNGFTGDKGDIGDQGIIGSIGEQVMHKLMLHVTIKPDHIKGNDWSKRW